MRAHTYGSIMHDRRLTSYASLSRIQMLWPSSPKKSGWQTFVADLHQLI